MSLADTRSISIDIESYLARIGTVFRAFRAQDSGCVSYGVEAEGRHWFVKHSREPRGIASLRRAQHVNTAAQHPALPHFHNAIETPDGLALVYDWVSAEVLRDVTPLSAAERRRNPATALCRFLALPRERILAALDVIYELHLLLADLGFVAVDFYDGCILYDFEAHRVYLADLDEYRPGLFLSDVERLPGSGRYMAPEEFVRGARIDQVTNVFTLGRAALELLGDGTASPAAWRGTEHLRQVALRATAPQRERRYPSVRAFVRDWQLAAYLADGQDEPLSPACVGTELVQAWRREECVPFAGWDFSHLAGRWLEETPPWSYEALVRAQMARARSVLDLGTGGGERLLALRDAWPPRVAATETYPPNARLAHQRLGPLGVEVVESADGLARPLPFAEGAFDLVINRHTGFNLREVERVLAPDGVFITQQVDGKSTRDLLAAFDSSPQWPYFNLDLALALVRSTRLVMDVAQTWSGRMIFTDVGALVYYLKAVPWLVDGFSVERHLPHLQRQQARLERGEPLAFEEKLLLFVARKPL